ncbi:MAG: methyl-accepting chemotaxis protein [Desulfosarcinaceae bacterium]|nr:methyl-accepting chemotaxis protein [Desulfosarcinaceae bacterium]
MSIVKRLLLAFGLSLIVATTIGLVGFFNISTFTRLTHTLVERDAAYVADTLRLKVEALQHRRYEKDFFLNIGKPEKQAKYLKKFDAVSASLKQRLDHLSEVSGRQADLPESVTATIETARSAYDNYYRSFIDLSRQVLADAEITPQKANKLMAPVKDQIYAFEKGVDELIGIGEEHLTAVTAAADHAGGNAKKTIVIALLVGFLAIAALAFFTIQRIRSGLMAVTDQLSEISQGEGDLTRRLAIKHTDEIGNLSVLFNGFLDSLQEMVKRIDENARVLATSTVEVSEVSAHLSGASDEAAQKAGNLAGSAEEVNANTNGIASAMEEAATNVSLISAAAEQMRATVTDIAQHTATAKGITGDAVSRAQGAATSINELSDYANKIGKVTEVITEISEQTNLLALNATIEAARAGEAGKGFAVVANEIKELARQTASATQDIKQQIGKIQLSTEKGVEIIEQISSVVGDVDDVVTTIASAVEEQSVTTGEISNNVAEASQGLQEINENVSQSATAINDISHEIEALNQSVKASAEGLGNIDGSTTELHKRSDDLQTLVGRFRV